MDSRAERAVHNQLVAVSSSVREIVRSRDSSDFASFFLPSRLPRLPRTRQTLDSSSSLLPNVSPSPSFSLPRVPRSKLIAPFAFLPLAALSPPPLLPVLEGLDYDPGMRVLVVFNGEWREHQSFSTSRSDVLFSNPADLPASFPFVFSSSQYPSERRGTTPTGRTTYLTSSASIDEFVTTRFDPRRVSARFSPPSLSFVASLLSLDLLLLVPVDLL